MRKSVYLDSTIPSYMFDKKESIKNYIETTQKWWKRTGPLQVPVPTRKEGEWWAQMEEVFHYD